MIKCCYLQSGNTAELYLCSPTAGTNHPLFLLLLFQLLLMPFLNQEAVAGLQLVQTSAARLLRLNSITLVLALLHWLPVKFKTEYFEITLKALHGFIWTDDPILASWVTWTTTLVHSKIGIYSFSMIRWALTLFVFLLALARLPNYFTE